MLTKAVFVIFLATLSVSLAKDNHDNEVVLTALGSGTNLLREFSKLVSDDPDKYSVDLNSLYKKSGIDNIVEQSRSVAEAQYKKGVELTNEYIKEANLESEVYFKKYVDIIKKEDPVLGEKLTKFYEKTVDLDRISEDILKYVLDSNKVNSALEKIKSALHPLQHHVVDAIKKVETIIIEHLPKKGKGKK